MENDYDAVIVGAGTGGLSAGIALKKAGKSYIILDRKKEIGLPVRSTGAVSLEWVKRIGMPTDESIIASKIFAMKFQTDRGRSISLSFDKPVGFVYDFTKYEKYLSRDFAGELNIKLETQVLSVDGSTVKTASEEYHGKNIVMASGPQSTFGQKLDKNNVLVAYEETRELPKRDDFQMILWFSDMAPGGYFWDFADSDSTRKIGVCYYPLNGEQPKNVLEKFTHKFPEVDGKMLHTMAHQIPLSRPSDKVTEGNRLYVGDMVNAVLNTTAGGLQGAFWTGKYAGEAISRGDLEIYQKGWDTEIKPWLMKHHNLHRKMHKNGAKSIGNLMLIAKMMPKSMKKKVFGGL